MKKNTNRKTTYPKSRKDWRLALVAVPLVCIIALCSFVFTGMTSANAADEAVQTITVATLDELLSAIEDEANDTILIADRIAIPDKPITIGSISRTITLRRAEGYTGDMLSVQVPSNYKPSNNIVATFINLIIDGANMENYAEASVLIHNSSEFKMFHLFISCKRNCYAPKNTWFCKNIL